MAKLHIRPDVVKGHINPEIQGHFSEHLGRCIYEGLYVGENSPIPNTNGMRNDVVEALKEIHIPVLRWPGGCFADEYHWKDGIGPKENRKKMINTHWGGVVEDNSFGTHEFMELCRQLGCKTYINGNVSRSLMHGLLPLQDALQTLYSWLLLMSMPVSMHLTGTYYQMLLLRYPAEHEVLHRELP